MKPSPKLLPPTAGSLLHPAPMPPVKPLQFKRGSSKAFRVANIVLLETSEINTLDVISADVMLITKAAAEKIGEVLV